MTRPACPYRVPTDTIRGEDTSEASGGEKDLMTPNWSASLVITILTLFSAVVAIGVALGVYAAKLLKKAEGTKD
jgi:hypothetical protein